MTKPKLLQKYISGERLLKKEQDYLWKKLRDEADVVFKRYIRERDQGCGCVSYGANACKNIVEHACHWIEAGWYSHRRDEDNVHGGCSTCNGYNKREHILYYTLWVVNKYGQKRADKQKFKKNKIKPTIDELVAIINKYKKPKTSIEKTK